MLNDKNNLMLIEKGGATNWIQEYLGGDVQWDRLITENVEPKYWGIKAMKTLRGEEGLNALGLNYLELRNILIKDDLLPNLANPLLKGD